MDSRCKSEKDEDSFSQRHPNFQPRFKVFKVRRCQTLENENNLQTVISIKNSKYLQTPEKRRDQPVIHQNQIIIPIDINNPCTQQQKSIQIIKNNFQKQYLIKQQINENQQRLRKGDQSIFPRMIDRLLGSKSVLRTDSSFDNNFSLLEQQNSFESKMNRKISLEGKQVKARLKVVDRVVEKNDYSPPKPNLKVVVSSLGKKQKHKRALELITFAEGQQISDEGQVVDRSGYPQDDKSLNSQSVLGNVLKDDNQSAINSRNIIKSQQPCKPLPTEDANKNGIPKFYYALPIQQYNVFDNVLQSKATQKLQIQKYEANQESSNQRNYDNELPPQQISAHKKIAQYEQQINTVQNSSEDIHKFTTNCLPSADKTQNISRLWRSKSYIHNTGTGYQQISPMNNSSFRGNVIPCKSNFKQQKSVTRNICNQKFKYIQNATLLAYLYSEEIAKLPEFMLEKEISQMKQYLALTSRNNSNSNNINSINSKFKEDPSIIIPFSSSFENQRPKSVQLHSKRQQSGRQNSKAFNNNQNLEEQKGRKQFSMKQQSQSNQMFKGMEESIQNLFKELGINNKQSIKLK